MKTNLFWPVVSRWLLVTGFFLAWVGSNRGQDVAVGMPEWFMAEPAPDTLPWLEPGFPSYLPWDLKTIGEPVYAICTRYSNPAGDDFLSSTHGSFLPFHRFVERELREHPMSVARKAGRPVASRVWFPVIFNPKSASTRGLDATPRLLAVAPAVVPDEGNNPNLPITVPMRLTLDATGRIVAAEPSTVTEPEKMAAVRLALAHWRFAPARRAGAAVSTELNIPVVCVPHDPTLTPPQLVGQGPMRNVPALKKIPFRVEVDLEFEIDTTGRMGERTVTRSTYPALNTHALSTLDTRRYESARRNGAAVVAKWRVTLTYNSRLGDPSDVAAPSDPSKIPAARRPDIQPKLRHVIAPVYPYALLRERVGGEAHALLAVNARGEVTAIRIVHSERRELGYALSAALEGFVFDPALKEGKPVEALVNYRHKFDVETDLDGRSRELLRTGERNPEHIRTIADLDGPLQPTTRVSPVITFEKSDPVTKGEAVAEVLVDEEGDVRLARLASTTHEAFGYAAVQAAASWRFLPPRVAGKGVVVRLRLPFSFCNEKSTAK